MRIAKINFEYGQKFTEAQIAILDEALIPFFNKKPTIKEPVTAKNDEGVEEIVDGIFTLDYWHQERVVDLEKMQGLQFKVVEIASDLSPGIDQLHSRPATVVNQKVNVAVPGIGLMQITSVKVATDCCTEDLQRELDRGWRILAICPQPGQRRPDYVLGNFGSDET